MVRRLIPTLRWMILLAGLRRIIDVQIRSVGIDLGKTTFHLIALSAAGQGAVAEEVHPEAAHHFYREPADFLDRDGGLFGGSLPRPGSETTRPQREADSGSVREAVCEVQQKRLPRCGSDRRSCRPPEH